MKLLTIIPLITILLGCSATNRQIDSAAADALAYAEAKTGYTAGAPPEVVRVDDLDAYIESIAPEYVVPDGMTNTGFYSLDDGRIYLPPNWKPDVFGKGTLTHEMVHYLQVKQGLLFCREVFERQALAVHASYLNEHNAHNGGAIYGPRWVEELTPKGCD